MSRLKRSAEVVILAVGVPLACLLAIGSVIAVGPLSVVIYTGALLAAWVFSAVALPILFGAMSPRELVDGYQSRLRHERVYEGEPIGGSRGFVLSKLQFDSWSRRREQFYPLEPHRRPRDGFPFWKSGRLSLD